MNQLWVYPWIIVFLVPFIGWQVDRLILWPSFGLALTAFDALIALRTCREYRRSSAAWRHMSLLDLL